MYRSALSARIYFSSAGYTIGVGSQWLYYDTILHNKIRFNNSRPLILINNVVDKNVGQLCSASMAYFDRTYVIALV